ncbi:hypothetical protein A8B78_02675 [Jannaschia sp. EhC01]|nr:hypothetical protein A8B78_02675 [Jannaschia sp. EhC01]
MYFSKATWPIGLHERILADFMALSKFGGVMSADSKQDLAHDRHTVGFDPIRYSVEEQGNHHDTL